MGRLIVFLINSTFNCFRKIGQYFGWRLGHVTVHDGVDCFFHMMRNIGLLILHRQVYSNGRVKFKARKFTWKEQLLTCGLLTVTIMNPIILFQIHYKPDMALHEIIWLLFFITTAIFSLLMIVQLVRHKKLLDNIHQLQEEADSAMTQLGIHFDYRFVIILAILAIGLAYINWMFITISYMFLKSESIYDCINFAIESFIFIMLVCPSLMFYGGTILICCVRFIVLNKYLGEVLDELVDEDIICDEEIQWTTSNSAEITAKLQLVSDIHMKHYEITKATMTFSSVFVFVFVHIVVAMTAIVVYFHFFKGIVLIELLFIDLTGLSVCVDLSIYGEILKRQAKYTLTLMADWDLCHFDPAVISIRSAILLQASHENFEPQSGGAVPINTSMLIFIVEASIALVVFFIQISV